MSLFVHTTPPPEPRTNNVRTIALLFAGILVVMAVGQLYSFEKFMPLLQSYELPGGDTMAALLAGLIVSFEVLALPFLLRMRLSPLMRWVSMSMGVAVAAIWVFLTVWVNTTSSAVENIGMLGTKVVLPVGWWAVLVSLALLVLAIWSAWGMWPRTSVDRAST